MHASHGILTVYPSGSVFTIPLGPTNPSLIIIAKETLVFRRRGFSPRLRLLVPTFLLLDAPARVTPSPSQQTRILSYHAIAKQWPRTYADLTRIYAEKMQVHSFWDFPRLFCVVLRSVLRTDILSFGTTFSPDYLRCEISRWVSCYAFFKWWLLLSQHPHCRRNLTSLSALNVDLGTLTWDLGCCPLDQWSFAPTVLLPCYDSWYSEFDRVSDLSACPILPVLYPQRVILTLCLNIFRREPAITKFD